MVKSLLRFLKNTLFGKQESWDEILKPFVQNRSCVVVDIGAANGLLPHWSKLDFGCTIVFIEPHHESLESLRNKYGNHQNLKRMHFVSDAISSVTSSRTLYKSRVPTGTSILKTKESAAGLDYIEKSYLFPLEKVQIQTKTLSQVLSDQGLNNMHFLKIDIQGAELEAIEGIERRNFDELVLIEAEIGLVETYEGQKFFADFVQFLNPYSFDVFDLRVARAHPCLEDDPDGYAQKFLGVSSKDPSVNARAWELDAVFIRNPEIYFKNGDVNSLVRIILAYCLYNGFTEALKCIDRMKMQNLLTPNEISDLRKSIKAWHHNVKISHPAFAISKFSFVLKFLRKFGLDRSQNWARYMWVDHPNS